MPTTTTNFGWTVPADTDLVKDGAAAIRTALGGVDTSMVDLKGGTTGQILSKTSNTDLDFTWATPATGGIVGCRVTTNAVLNVTSGGTTTLNFQTEEYDTDNFHSTVTNTSRVTIPVGKGGKYLLTSALFWTSGTGTIDIYLRKNGSSFRRYDFNGSSTNSHAIADTMILSEGDYIYFEFYQNSGSTRTLDTPASLSLVYLGA